MELQLRLRAVLTRFKRQIRTRTKGTQRAREKLEVTPGCGCRMGAHLMMMTTSHFALHIRLESASSRNQLAKGAQEASISVIRKDASVQSHITFARILTDMRGRHLQFHKVHHLFLGSSSQEEVPFSRAALQAGLRVVSVDHEVVQPFAQVVNLDLTTDSGSRILWDIFD